MELKGELKNVGNSGVVALSAVSSLTYRVRDGGDREELSMKA